MVRTVSYSSMRRRIVSPFLTNSIGYGCSMIVGMPLGSHPGATVSVMGFQAARVFLAPSVRIITSPQSDRIIQLRAPDSKDPCVLVSGLASVEPSCIGSGRRGLPARFDSRTQDNLTAIRRH